MITGFLVQPSFARAMSACFDEGYREIETPHGWTRFGHLFSSPKCTSLADVTVARPQFHLGYRRALIRRRGSTSSARCCRCIANVCRRPIIDRAACGRAVGAWRCAYGCLARAYLFDADPGDPAGHEIHPTAIFRISARQGWDIDLILPMCGAARGVRNLRRLP